MFGKQDPFVELHLYSQYWTWKSKIIESGGKTPVWNETVSVDVKTATQNLTLKVLDEDLGGAKDTVCTGEVALTELCREGGDVETWVPC